MLYVEEAAYIDPGVFYEVIVPLLMVRNTAIILITTPSSNFSFCSFLTDKRKANGDPVFPLIQAGRCCERCMGTPNEDYCKHAAARTPEWKPDNEFERAAEIYGSNKTLLQRELLGRSSDGDNMAFRAKTIRALEQRAVVTREILPIDRVYIGYDPNGGASATSEGSDSAIVSFYYDGGNVVVRWRARVVCVCDDDDDDYLSILARFGAGGVAAATMAARGCSAASPRKHVA